MSKSDIKFEKPVGVWLHRALSSALSNVPNAKYLAHLAHQTQKQTLIRCAKYAKIMKHATVRSHFWERTDENAISIYSFFIHLSLTSLITLFFWSFLFSLRHSLSLPFQSSLLKISLIFAQDLLSPHLAVNLHSLRHRPPQPLPPTFRSLNRFVGVIFGMGFDVWVLGHWLIGWVGILGRWLWRWLVEFWAGDVCGCTGRRCLWL